MKIVHYLSEVVLAHGGVVRSVLDLCAGLAKAGHEVQLLCFDGRDLPPDWRRGGPLIPKASILGWPKRPKPIRQFQKEDVLRIEGLLVGARALHLHGPWEATNPQIATIASGRALSYIVSTHGMLDEWTIAQGYWKKRAYLALAGRSFLDRAGCILCTAEAERTQVARWHSNPNVQVLPLLFDLAPFKENLNPAALESMHARIKGEGPIVLFLSRLHIKKGLEYLIEAVAELKRRGIACRLAIAGTTDDSSYDAALRRRVERAGIEDRSTFLGMILGADKTALFHAAAVSVLPSSQENWGFALIESLACATPIITTKAVDIWPELERSGGGLIVPQDAKAVADALEPLLRRPEEAVALGMQGKAWVFNELEPAAVIRRYEELYRAV